MNKSDDNIIIKVHRITDDGQITSIRYEDDLYATEEISTSSYMPLESLNLNLMEAADESKLNLVYTNLELVEGEFRCFKIEDVYYMDAPNTNGAVERKQLLNFTTSLNIPTMIRCQNCETNFPTKYQYQRHQCEFNAEKVVLKPDADFKDVDKGVRIKYDCSTCGKLFVSKNNLERHQASHENTKLNICEHCNKQFVSENRLRIHKENHCKKAGDISKFYRSDVTVWKCKKCHEVFSSVATASFHVEICNEIIELNYNNHTSLMKSDQKELEFLQEEIKNVTSLVMNGDIGNQQQDNKDIEKILTEILLQCEFCNRTYADKNLLLMHSKKHTTDKNYECVNCDEVFDSYAVAAQHWMKKCSEFANLFYLPKLTYCEYCDRTFKSHEILYTHKIKKKHYTPKMHINTSLENNPTEESTSQFSNSSNKDKLSESKDNINKLIEDVLKTLDVPMNKINSNEIRDDEESNNDKPENESTGTMQIKSENQSESSGTSLVPSVENEECTGKKKRGRKRRWSKQGVKIAKRICAVVDEGFKYQCERCVKTFDTVLDLETHREKEHATIFNCEECGQVLHSAKALLIHSRAHKSLKPYVCDTCGRSYSQTSHLWQHMRFHQGIKPFACPHEGCEARYTIRPDLKDHIRKVHTRERPFKCNVCNKCFLTGSVYYQHRLIHTNDRRYGCDVCQKRFFRADALNNHKRIHTDERPYACTVCGREFRQKGDRNKHFRTQHPEALGNI